MTLLRAMNASGAGRHGWASMNSAILYGGGDGGVCARAYVCTRMLACVRDVFAIYDNKIWPRLIMIIIKIIILYFIQIRHWCFPLNGYPSSSNNNVSFYKAPRTINVNNHLTLWGRKGRSIRPAVTTQNGWTADLSAARNTIRQWLLYLCVDQSGAFFHSL